MTINIVALTALVAALATISVGKYAPLTNPEQRATMADSAFIIDPALGIINRAHKGRVAEIADQTKFPPLGLSDIDMAIVRFTLDPNGTNPMHVHPRATEMVFVLKGRLSVETGPELGNKKFVRNIVEAGFSYVFPQALVNGQRCLSEGRCEFVSMFNSGNPGVFDVEPKGSTL